VGYSLWLRCCCLKQLDDSLSCFVDLIRRCKRNYRIFCLAHVQTPKFQIGGDLTEKTVKKPSVGGQWSCSRLRCRYVAVLGQGGGAVAVDASAIMARSYRCGAHFAEGRTTLRATPVDLELSLLTPA
jgi:hypothetical protein